MVTSISTSRGIVTIRSGVEEDAAAYRDLRLEALRNHPDAFGADYAESAARPMSFWVERLKFAGTGKAAKMSFAVHDQQFIGMCGIFRNDSTKVRHSATIVGMYVKPDWRGMHVAEALINAAVDWARTQGVTIVKLAVVTTNVNAIRAYAHSGFRVYGVEPLALYVDGVYYDELLMAREI